jgi:hypothetical protein
MWMLSMVFKCYIDILNKETSYVYNCVGHIVLKIVSHVEYNTLIKGILYYHCGLWISHVGYNTLFKMYFVILHDLIL